MAGVKDGQEGIFKVVHERVAVRAGPSVKALPLKVLQRGAQLRGTVQCNGDPWLRLSIASIKEHKLALQKDETAYVLIDGASVGLGQLLRPVAAKVEVAARPPAAEQTGATGEFIVVHTKVVVRCAPSTDARLLGGRLKGALVSATPCDIERQPWLQLADGEGWMLADGAALGLGRLLEPVADPLDLLAWARQQQLTSAGASVTWTERTEPALQHLEAEAMRQVSELNHACECAAVRNILIDSGFLQPEDATLGAQGMASAVLRQLLRRRAGELVLGEELGGLWGVKAFEDYLQQKVLPIAPYYCRLVLPEGPPARLLVLCHGGFVRGDDLQGEALALRSMLPGLAIALPEAPNLVEGELRVWWPLEGKEPLRAPAAALSRLQATVEWLQGRFQGLPMAIGGFSQGAMLVAHGLTRLREPPPKGAIFLSGLAVTFQAADVPCLALHGDCDDRVRLADAKLVQSKTHIPLEVFPGLGHEISDAVLDRVAAFCEEVLPVPERAIVVAKETPVLLQEARQAKLLRWVKKISQVITMFDDQRFMSHIVHLDMVALPAARQLGGGLVKYELHDAGPESRGLVVLFHGKQRNLREGARPLVEAYCRLKLSVCVIDYRQRFSQFCVDASVVLEELLGQQELPVLLHGAGCGGVHALHVAIASHSYPAQVARSLKLLVLDGSVANFRSLPPTPTGCIAVDPIGNDEKLKYIDLPVCILGGDDECCGYQVTQKHFTVLQRGAEMALPKSQVLAMDTGPALEGDRLGPALFAAVSKALDPVFMASWPSQSSASSRFFEDVLAGDEDATDALAQKFTPEVLSGLCQGALARARAPAAQLRLWELRADRGREGSWAEHVAALHQLERHGFSGGQKGFQEFEAVLSLHCQKDPALEAERRAVQEILDLRVLDAQVAKAEKQPGAHGVTLRQCYEVIESSLAEWLSEDKWRELLAAAQKEDGPPVRIARGVIRAASDDLTGRQARSLGVDSATLGAVYGHFCSVDPFLASRSAHLQEQIMQLSKKLTAEFPTPAAQPALAAQPQKAPKSGYKEQSEVEVLVHIDRDLNLFSKFKLPGGSTGTAVKEKVASFNAMGAAVFQLCLPSGRALGDKDLVTDGMELDVRDG